MGMSRSSLSLILKPNSGFDRTLSVPIAKSMLSQVR